MYKILIYIPILFVLGCQRNIEKTTVTEELVLSIAENGSIYSPNEFKTVVLMNMSNRAIEFIGSKCVNETGLFELSDEKCEIKPLFLCGHVSTEVIKLKPGESHLCHLSIECISEKIKIGFNYMKPTKKYFKKKIISYNDLINDKELIKSSKLIWSK